MNESMSLSEIWARAFNRVQREIDVPTVWLAMQAVRPIVIDGNRFVATIPPDLRYLSMNLETSDAAHAVESALEEIAGRPLAFLLIDGQTVEDWEAEKAEFLGTSPFTNLGGDDGDSDADTGPATASMPVFGDVFADPPASFQAAFPTGSASAPPPASEGFDTWEKLNDFIAHEQKQFPSFRFPHGQARFLLLCARMISGTMDRLMAAPVDNNQERQLAKSIERLASALNLDPFFVSLEVARYRQWTGRE